MLRSLHYVQALTARPRQAGAAVVLFTRRLTGGILPASYDNIIVEKRDRVALITLHRPKALNALNSALMCAPSLPPPPPPRTPARCGLNSSAASAAPRRVGSGFSVLEGRLERWHKLCARCDLPREVLRARARARACRGLTRRCCSNDLSHAMAVLDADPGVSALVLTGSEKAFAAGADIKEMAQFSKVLYVVTFYVEKALGH
jgi:hypothetical protein